MPFTCTNSGNQAHLTLPSRLGTKLSTVLLGGLTCPLMATYILLKGVYVLSHNRPVVGHNTYCVGVGWANRNIM